MTLPRRACCMASLVCIAGFIACGSHEPARTADTAVSATSAIPASATSPGSRDGDQLQADTGSTASVPTSGTELLSADRLSGVAASLSHGSTTARSVFNHGAYWAVQARRVVDGAPEVHDRWEDVTVVQAGRATLLAGGRVEGSSLQSPGEHRGGHIVGGTRYPLAAGDVIVVPAGTPHQFVVMRGDSIRYLTIKTPPRSH